MVYLDLLRTNGWAELRPLSLDLPPCACCHQDISRGQQSEETRRTSRAHAGGHRCGIIAQGIAGTVAEEDGVHRNRNDDDGPGAEVSTLKKVVFAVNAGCALPTRRFSDVVAAAEEYLLRLDASGTDARNDGRHLRSRVLAAFCDGSSIIYYSVSSGIDT
ncbi:unnamed protein product [Hapterophycus canaliculatus]